MFCVFIVAAADLYVKDDKSFFHPLMGVYLTIQRALLLMCGTGVVCCACGAHYSS